MNVRIRTLAVAFSAALLALSACGGGDSALTSNSDKKAPSTTIVVGSANFQESELLGQIYASALEAKGVKVSTKLNIGAREVYIPALKDGSVDLLPEYNGALLDYFDKKNTTSSSTAVYAALKQHLPAGTEVLDQSVAQDKDTLSVTRSTAQKYHLKSIADLKPVASKLTVGAGPEFKLRQTGLVGLEKVYGLHFKQFKPLDVGGPLTVAALKKGSVDVGNIFSTDSSIDTDHFVVLTDPKNLFLAENVLPLIRKNKATATVRDTLNALAAKLTTDNLAAMLKEVEVNKADASTVAKKFLTTNGLA